MSAPGSQLVGRERELAAMARGLERLARGQATLLELSGEPGIGKTRLLGELSTRAERQDCLVLAGRATEFERDAPYGLWIDAIDPYLQRLDAARLRRLASDELDALAVALPAFADALGAAAPVERYVVHRALRGLLERLAGPRRLVLCLDDVHWADPASLDLLAALARRPPSGAVLLALAYREGQAPSTLVAALADAVSAARAERLAPAQLSRAEAAAMCGGDVTTQLYELSGGNPFYLEQLARARPDKGSTTTLGPAAGIPVAVAAALAGELDALPGAARRVLDAAAVAGEPFEPELVAEVAALGEEVTLAALDALLEPALIRPTATPRRFAFRHPLIRHAVYAATPGAWRLQAHARAAAALERRGAGPVERAHHVEHAAQRGDRAAIELLADAAERVFEQAPASAARYLDSALRLLPANADLTPRRIELLKTRAYALFGAGQLQAAHAALADTLEQLPRDAWEQRTQLICSQAAIEAWSGRPLAAPLRSLRAALAEEPAAPSLASFKLRMTLASREQSDLQLDRVPAIVSEALAHARDLGDRRLEHAALGMLALAHAVAGRADQARAPLERVLAYVADADDDELGHYELGFCDLGAALGHLDRYEEALGQLRRGVADLHRTGHGYFIPVLLATQLHPLIQLGRLGEAIAVAEEAIEAAWTSGNPGLLLGAHEQLAVARQLSGDIDGAVREAREAVRLAAEPRLWRGKAGSTLGVILADGQPEAGIATILHAGGGWELPELIPADRPLVWAALTEAELQRSDLAAAEQGAARLEAAAQAIGTPLAHALASRTRAAVLLADDRAAEAVTAAARAAAISSLPLEAARARALEGVALARSGDRQRGIAALKQAADEFERFGARRLRDHAKRELRRLGVRTSRHGPVVARHAQGIHALTTREREVAALVLAGKRNADIARELVLSLRTIETHTRHIYAKLGVSSRVEFIARVSERDRDPFARPTSTAAPDPGAE